MMNNRYPSVKAGGGYYLERRNGTGLLVPPRSPEGGVG